VVLHADAMGKDVVLIETVGVGQDEVEVCRLAHSTVVVVVPGLGDDIQAIKAGILEVADLFAVNKADREGAERTVRDLRSMLELNHAMLSADATAGWEIPIVKTVAARDEGTAELWEAIEQHHAFLRQGPGLLQRESQRARSELVELLRERLLREALHRLAGQGGRLDELSLRIARRELDPYGVAEAAARAPAARS
jgi:LAO/AO transport system kinase